MSRKTRASILSLTVIVVLIFSAVVGPTVVYADGETPPETPATETVTTNPEETSVETTGATEEAPPEAAPEATEVPAEAPAEATPEAESTSEAIATDAPVEETAAPAPEESAPVLAEVPENTTVTVLDENGESQPLATQEAADAIETSDPIWCPGAQSPTPGANGCTDSFASFDELLTFLAGNASFTGAGTIYVEQGAYQGGESVVDFNAYNLSNISSADLAITGGWNTSTGTVDNTSTSDFTNTQIVIGSSTTPWGGSLTLSNLNLDFTNTNGTIPPTPENGLTLYANGDVNLTNVTVTNAASAGAEIQAGGGVTIEDSQFDRNKTAGAVIRSLGPGGVTITNTSFSNPSATSGRRQIVGADITSAGGVTLSQVVANFNREAGVNIDASGNVVIGGVFDPTTGQCSEYSSFSGTKVMNGTTFGGYGLNVVTGSTISLDCVQGNDNFLYGASLDAAGNIAIANSVFNANTTESPGFIDDTGLFIVGGGQVSLFNVQANDNRLYGAQIDAVGNVTINNSQFNSNQGIINTGGVDTYNGHGLQITTLADILINNTQANGNMLFGGELNADGQVAIANSSFSDTSTGNAANPLGQGLAIISGGNTSLASVVLNNNQTAGANIQAGGFVMLDSVTATNNGTDGVAVQTSCVHLIGGNYSGNGQHGLNLGTSALNLLAPPSAGDIFPANPPTCTFALAVGSGLSASSSNVFTSLQLAPEKSGSASDVNSANLTLNAVLGGLRSAHGLQGLFAGKYGYVYSSEGFQVFAYASSEDALAMR